MTGIVLAQEGAILGQGAVHWNDIVGTVAPQEAENNDQTMPFSDNITAIATGLGADGSLFYVKNGGAPVTYAGAFAVVAGDHLHWGISYKSTKTGTVTVSRATGPTVIDAFNFTIT